MLEIKKEERVEILVKLQKINWARANSSLWEGRAIIGGRISKARQNVVLTVNVVKDHLELALTPEEQEMESLLTQSKQ